MRIGIDCHFESKIRQGTNTYISELVNAFSKIDSSNKYFLLNANYKNIQHSSLKNNIIKKSIATNSTKKNILYGYRKIVKESKLDLLHTNYLSPLFIPCKSIVTLHDILYITHKKYFPPLHSFLLRFLTPLTIRNSNKIITVSEYSKKQINKYFSIDNSKIKVTLEAASTDFKKIGNKRELIKKIKKKYRLQNDFILYVGRIAPIKNISRMLKIFIEYNKNTNIKLSFVLVGDFDSVYPDNEVRKIFNKTGIDNQVVILKNIQRDDLVLLYNSAKVLFFVSCGEGFGLPILESMSCGLPVITSNVTSCPEIAGDAAILVSPHNDKEIYCALTEVLRNHDLRSEMIAKGLRRKRLFSWDECAKQTIKIYHSLFECK